MLIITCITYRIIEAVESVSAQRDHWNDEHKRHRVLDYNKIIGMRWTDKHGNPWFIDSQGIPKSIRKFDSFPIYDAKRAAALVTLAHRISGFVLIRRRDCLLLSKKWDQPGILMMPSSRC